MRKTKTVRKREEEKMSHELYQDIYTNQFSFGKNWKLFLKKLNQDKITSAENSLKHFLNTNNLDGKSFLDFGCGSGIFSLAALNLGANLVYSIDIDDFSIECACYLRSKYNIPDTKWIIKKGSALDTEYLKSLPKFDIVYSWGVLHHTGDMNKALSNITIPMKDESILYISIYNEYNGFPLSSKSWKNIKRFYSKRCKLIQRILDLSWASIICFGLIVGLKNPITYIKNYGKGSGRGMSFMSDVRDWMGGYPFEYATADFIIDYYKKLGYELVNIKRTAMDGCNEFLFRRVQ
jgi:2-polyprenyl-3-methyl-5-hydroxy-6-metoxy-1,4-benzoquinol methylase